MALEIAIKILGWGMVGIPVGVFVTVSAFMIIGASKDDGMLMAVVMLLVTVFLVGCAILGLMYLTDWFPFLLGSAGL